MYFRKFALAAILAGGFALPALAQTVPAQTATPPAPQADAANPMPDTGVKKAPEATVKHHRHHRHHIAHKVKAQMPAAPTDTPAPASDAPNTTK